MARSFPRFLLSKSTTTKSKGTFIVHTLEPAFICSVTFNDARHINEISILKMFGDFDLNETTKYAYSNVPDWWKYSGIHESEDPRDIVVSRLSKLEFLKVGPMPHFEVEEVQEVIKVIFPTKTKSIFTSASSYGLKHDMERISRMFISNRGVSKYCSNDTLKQAMANEGFICKRDSPGSPNENYNISERELNRIRRIAASRVNLSTQTF